MLSYYLVYPVFYVLSLLPMSILYGIANLLKVLLFDILGYRKKVVETNLKNSFPNKSAIEINRIAQDFYQYFCDLIVEVIKSISISEKELTRRCILSEETIQLMTEYVAKNQSIIFAIGHHGNWEWAGNAYGLQSPVPFYGIYRPLYNKGFDRLIEKVRTRFRTRLISDRKVFDEMRKNTVSGIASTTVFLTDQTPSGKSKYWTTFLNQDTPVFWGVERAAKKFGFPVVFADITRVKRGYYRVEARTLIEDPLSIQEEGYITERHTKAIEASIIAQPETWLWTHRRWKHKRPK
jgi:KDO2-lipid IV(A) lauroyltransferase